MVKMIDISLKFAKYIIIIKLFYAVKFVLLIFKDLQDIFS